MKIDSQKALKYLFKEKYDKIYNPMRTYDTMIIHKKMTFEEWLSDQNLTQDE